MDKVSRSSRTFSLPVVTLLAVLGFAGCSGSAPLTLSPTTVAPIEIPSITSTHIPTLEPGDSEHTLSIGGKNRGYILHIPPGLEQGSPVPLVIMLHGFSTGVSYLRSASKLDDVADANGFIVAYPKGIGVSWNGGSCCGIAAQDNVDDVGFVRQMISDLKTSFNLDTKRIYVAGYNVGGMMAYRLGCEMADTFAAISSVSGVLFFEQCQPVNAVALLHVHGLGDSAVPYLGGESNCDICSGISTLPPVEKGIKKWVEWDGCSTSPVVEKEGTITHTVYIDCQVSTAVELYTIDGLNYTWPVPTGSGENNFPASQILWDFFAAHPKP